MFSREPVAGYFYTNQVGQLIRVRLLVYVAGRISRVVVEYLDQHIVNASWDEWQEMGLSIYTEWHGSDARSREMEFER